MITGVNVVKVCVGCLQLTVLMFVEPRGWNENPSHAGRTGW